MDSDSLNITTNPKEVMAALMHADKVRRAQLELDQMLIEGLESPLIPEEEIDWDALRRPALEAAAKRGSK
jgi:hypothetical protein